ncbi:hypothetical protein ACH4U7_06125 [Streptomyces sp. NPDC020845]|uniref:hypothetical protein n=1 Tax=Streptomyces sp. NPDC020845 TaxID=3365096 RepID=UPI003787A13E
MDHLLTVDSAEFDGGSAKTWLPVEDRPPVGEIRDLPHEQRKAVQRAPGLMIGDMGGVYVNRLLRGHNHFLAAQTDIYL